jgi:hypothetical protein
MRYATLLVGLLVVPFFGENQAQAQQRVIFQQQRPMFQQPRATFQQARSTFQGPLAPFQVPPPLPANFNTDLWIVPNYLSDQLAAATETTEQRFPAPRIRQFYWGGPRTVVVNQPTVPVQVTVPVQPTVPVQAPVVIQTAPGDQGSQNGGSQNGGSQDGGSPNGGSQQ